METEQQTYTCNDCNNVITIEEYENGEYQTIESELVCQSCIDDNYFYCDNCGEYKDTDDMTSFVDDSDRHYCESCRDTYGYECNDCNDWYYSSSDLYNIEDNWICNSCRDNYFTCYSCDEYYSTDQSHYCDECSNDYCGECYNDSSSHNCEGNNNNGQDHTAIYTPVTTIENGKYLSSNRLAGVEIEVENGSRSGLYNELPTGTGLTGDGSLQNGIEIQSRPSNRLVTENDIKQICTALSGAGYEITSRCGLHVHLDASDFVNNPVRITHLLSVMFAVEDMIYSILPPSRWTNSYCRHLTHEYVESLTKLQTIEEIENMWYHMENSNNSVEYKKKQKYDDSRYSGLNLHSLFYRGTVEFRYHSGTMNPIKILQWIKLLQRIMDYAATEYDEKQIQTLSDMPTGNKKFACFAKVFSLDENLQAYLLDRVAKFNPNFIVKFNKGIVKEPKKIAGLDSLLFDLQKTLSDDMLQRRIALAREKYQMSKQNKYLSVNQITEQLSHITTIERGIEQ